MGKETPWREWLTSDPERYERTLKLARKRPEIGFGALQIVLQGGKSKV